MQVLSEQTATTSQAMADYIAAFVKAKPGELVYPPSDATRDELTRAHEIILDVRARLGFTREYDCGRAEG